MSALRSHFAGSMERVEGVKFMSSCPGHGYHAESLNTGKLCWFWRRNAMPSANRRCFFVVCSIILLIIMSSQGDTAMGRERDMEPSEHGTRVAVDRFNETFNRHDAEALERLLTEDTIFEDTSPAPDGRRIEGRVAVANYWREWFGRNTDARFETEQIIVSGNRATVLWVYRKMRDGQPWHLRGVDVFTVRDGKIAAKLAYVKG
jgi:ketosteroid isomerase-like protein